MAPPVEWRGAVVDALHNWLPSGNEKCKMKIWQTPSLVRGSVKLVRAWRPDLLDMLGFWYNDLTRAQDCPKVTLVETLDAEIYYVYGLADFSCSRVSTATAGIS